MTHKLLPLWFCLSSLFSPCLADALSAYPQVAGACEGAVLKVTVPEGICLKDGTCGHGLYATKSFRAGEVLYLNQWQVIDDGDAQFLLSTDQGEFVLDTTTHSCSIGGGKRALYNFDSMMNHSCDPTTYSFCDEEMYAKHQYFQIAARDIEVGEEITCDYSLFEYDCQDKGIDQCYCNAANCRGRIWGFKWIPFAQQQELLSRVDQFIFNKFLDDHPEIIYCGELQVPDHIDVVLQEDHSSKIVSKGSFRAGDILYELDTLLFREDQLILFRINNNLMWVDNVMHTVRRAHSMREFYYVDTFMNHSCDPNTVTYYTSENHFEARALKDIAPGDELTCDYAVFDTDPDGEGFYCECGAAECRGWVY